MDKVDKLELALTYDDVMLVPQKSNVLPRETDVSTYLTPRIKLNIPLISAAMDTVTESRLAIALAQEGGLGIIHKNSTIEAQTAEVDKVKRSEAGMISNPITLSPDKRVSDALNIMKHYHISGIPIVQEDGRLVGIVTNRDLRFVKKIETQLSDVMTKDDLVTVPEGTTLETAEQTLHQHRIEKLLVVDKKGNLAGLITIKDINKRIKYPNACKDERGRLRVGAAVSVSADTDERVERLVAAGVDVIVVDTAHGFSEGVLKTVQSVRKKYPKLNLIAGNIVTADAAKALADLGVDAVKVGVGPGSICTTRIVAASPNAPRSPARIKSA
jgi:IMP dehydrogenase